MATHLTAMPWVFGHTTYDQQFLLSVWTTLALNTVHEMMLTISSRQSNQHTNAKWIGAEKIILA